MLTVHLKKKKTLLTPNYIVACSKYPRSIKFCSVSYQCLSCTTETHSCSSYSALVLHAADSKRMSAEKLLIPKMFGDTRQKRDFGAHSIYKTPHLGNTPGVR